MNKPSPAIGEKIIFFGNERLATGVATEAQTVRQLIITGYDVVAIVSHHTDSRSRNDRKLEIASVAEEYGIPLLLPDKAAEVIEQLRSFGAVIGVLAAYGKIVPQSVIDVFPYGIINIHPSLLPLHRGPIPIEAVILDGSDATGVSVMQLAQAMDAGPLYSQRQVALTDTETKQSLADNLLKIGGEMILEVLPGILDGSLSPQPQAEAAATYDSLIRKEDGLLDFTKPAAQLEREIRAYLAWPGSRTSLADRNVIITAAHVKTTPENSAVDSVGGSRTDVAEQPPSAPGDLWRAEKQFGFYTSDGVLVIDRLKPAGKQEMSATAFLAGYHI